MPISADAVVLNLTELASVTSHLTTLCPAYPTVNITLALELLSPPENSDVETAPSGFTTDQKYEYEPVPPVALAVKACADTELVAVNPVITADNSVPINLDNVLLAVKPVPPTSGESVTVHVTE